MNNDEKDKISIHINKALFKVASKEMTGAEIRQLPTPAIGPEYDLWQEVPSAPDVPIENDQTVELRDGMHFFSAPATINPGVR